MLAPSCGSQHLRPPLISSSKRQPRLACIRQQGSLPAKRVSLSVNQQSCSSSFSYQQQRPSRPSLLLRARGKDSYKSWIGAEESQESVDEPQDQQEFVEAPSSGSLEISKISSNVRDRVESAMETLNCRATVGDVAGAAGLKVDEAEAALNALAADTLGTLQVSEAGDILYVLPPDFKARLRNRSLKLRLEPALKGLRGALSYLTRISFGTALIASVTLVWVAILAIQSGSSNREDNRRSGGYGGGYGGYGSRGGVYFNLSDILWYWDPWYYRRHQSRLQQGHRPGFLEAIFSFVFGDGDPNQGYEERRWKAVGQLIASKKGVVTAEELGPYLDVTAANVRGEHNDGEVLDEGFVVPALIRFGGSADVDDNGNIVYTFSSFQKTAQRRAVAQPSPAAAQQAPWQFSTASQGQLIGAAALGVANLVGVLVLGGYAANPSIRYQLMNSSLSFLPGLLPALQAYAGAFFAIPFVRYLFNQRKNTKINAQNEFRTAMQRALANPGMQLRMKLEHARRTAEQKILGDRDMVFRSDRPGHKQSGGTDLDDFDSRLGKGKSSSERIASEEKYRITP